MIPVLLSVGVATSLVAAAYAGFLLWRNRRLDRIGLGLTAVAVVAMLVCLVAIGIGLVAGAPAVTEPVVLIAYAATAWLLPAGAIWLAAKDDSRWGSGVVVIALLGTAVMLLRCQQLWAGDGVSG